jgi:hypothetical protein
MSETTFQSNSQKLLAPPLEQCRVKFIEKRNMNLAPFMAPDRPIYVAFCSSVLSANTKL